MARSKTWQKNQKKNQKQLIEVLCSLSKEHLEVILKYLDQCAVDHISSLVYNLIYFENRNLGKHAKKKLLKCLMGNEKKALYLSKRSNKIERKKKILAQNGGFLGTLMGIGLPILAEIIASQVR